MPDLCDLFSGDQALQGKVITIFSPRYELLLDLKTLAYMANASFPMSMQLQYHMTGLLFVVVNSGATSNRRTKVIILGIIRGERREWSGAGVEAAVFEYGANWIHRR